jgi:hypothetical protein
MSSYERPAYVSYKWLAKISFIGYFILFSAIWDIIAVTRFWPTVTIYISTAVMILFVMAASQQLTEHDPTLGNGTYVVNCYFTPLSFISFFIAAFIPVIFLNRNTMIGTNMNENKLIIGFLEIIVVTLITIGFKFQQCKVFPKPQNRKAA